MSNPRPYKWNRVALAGVWGGMAAVYGVYWGWWAVPICVAWFSAMEWGSP